MILLPSTAIVALVLFKPDIPTIIGTALKCLLLLSGAIFIISLISQIKKFFASARESSSTNTGNSSAYSDAISKARQSAQASYNEQAAEHLENVILPKQEETRRSKEEKFYRFTRVPWSSPGHTLGGSKSKSELSLGQGNSSPKRHDKSSDPVRCDSGLDLPKRVNPLNLPEEPDINTPNSITVALKSPLGKIHKRRFLVTDRVEFVLTYMTSIGYHPNLYGLYLSYPRQSVSNNTTSSLQELGIVQGTLLNIEEKE